MRVGYTVLAGALTSGSVPGLALAQQSSQGLGIATPAGTMEPLAVYPQARYDVPHTIPAQVPKSGFVTVYPPLRHEVVHSDTIPLQTPDGDPVNSDTLEVVSPGALAAAPMSGPESGSGPALAQQSSDGAGVPTPTGAVRVGPLAVYPSVRYEVMRNDNLLQQASGSGLVKSDTLQVLSTSVRAEARQGANTFATGVSASFGRYSEFSGDNYNNNSEFVSANLNPDTRLRVGLQAVYSDGHDPRGSTTDPLTPTPNRYRQQTLGGNFSYGAPGAQGRVDLQLGNFTKRYYNNADSGVQSNNRDENIVGGTFYWRIAPKTSLLAQAKRTGIDFKDDTTTLDSTEMLYLAGVTWEATAATTGIVKVGTVRKDFKDATRGGERAPSWDAQIQWTPLTYSRWDFITSKTWRETTVNFGNTVLATNYMVRWTHSWTSQISTAATGSYGIDDYKGLAVARNDKLPSLGLRATYQMRRWLDFGADYNWSKRDSNLDSADFKKNVFMLFVNATL